MTVKSLIPALIVVLALAACTPDAKTKIGEIAPLFTAMDLEDKTVKLADFRGKVVVVNFWWSGCGPCLHEMPEFDQVYKDYKDKGLEIIGVNMGQSKATITSTNRRLDVSYLLLADELKIATRQYGVVAAPTSFLIDRDGVLRERINGPLTKEALSKKVAGML